MASAVPDVAVSSLPPSAPPVQPHNGAGCSRQRRAAHGRAGRSAYGARHRSGPSLSQQVVGAVMVQVASFSSRDNANRAMGQLNAAGIVGATISDIAAGGRTLFRLRVPASDHASAAELVGRIAGLGLGSPQIVKD